MLKKILLIMMLIAPMSIYAQKFGHVRVNEIVTAMPEFTKYQTEMQAIAKQFQDEAKIMQDEYNKKATELQQEAEKLPKNILERRQKDLQDMIQKYQQFEQEAQQSLQKSEQEKLEPIYKKLQDAIKAVGNEGGYTFIVEETAEQIVPFMGSSVIDVTTAVKTKLGIK